ncbi:MAG: precorrin-8X methylmutase, partial [Desulfobacterales bacterium]
MKPHEIEALSFQIIDGEAGPHGFEDAAWQVVRRMIHTSADFDYQTSVRFSRGAVESGVAAIRQGIPIVTDTFMALSGIRKADLELFG